MEERRGVKRRCFGDIMHPGKAGIEDPILGVRRFRKDPLANLIGQVPVQFPAEGLVCLGNLHKPALPQSLDGGIDIRYVLCVRNRGVVRAIPHLLATFHLPEASRVME